MVKPIFVRSDSLPSDAVAASASGGGGDPPVDNDPKSNAAVKTEEGTAAVTAAGRANGNKSQIHADTTSPYINFSDIYAELQKYKQENNGSLSIPTSHPVLSKIIDGLNDSSEGIESLSKKRWEDQLTALKQFREDYGDVNVPRSHPTLGIWVETQRKHYKLYEARMPSALTKKRFVKLKAIGLGDCGVNGEGRFEENENQKENSNQSDKAKEGDKKVDTTRKETDSNDKSSPGQLAEEKQKENSSREFVSKQPAAAGDESNATVSTGGDIQKKGAATNGKQKKDDVKPSGEKTEVKNEPVEHTIPLKKEGSFKKLKGKCDICEKKDGFWGHNMQQCKECKVLVHELCYGIPETDGKDPNFVCHACKAVGTEIEVNVPSQLGGCAEDMGKKREKIMQKQRPSRCVLCSHEKGIHAMHPLLDVEGEEGRQLYTKLSGRGGNGKELVWVHTLCASVICANPRTRSSVFGCDKYGSYYGGDEESGEEPCEEEELKDDTGNGNKKEEGESRGIVKEDGGCKKDDANIEIDGSTRGKEGGGEGTANKATLEKDNAGAESSEEEEEYTIEPTKSYAIASEEGYRKNLNDHRTLKCVVCDRRDKTWRVPVQCPAGDDEEYNRWKDRHRKMLEPCSVAMHVGCARWGCVEPEGSHLEKLADGKTIRRCYFTPGRDVDDDSSKGSDEGVENNTVASCYCAKHARDIVVNNPNRIGKPGSPTVRAKSGSPAARATTTAKKKATAKPAAGAPRNRPQKRSKNKNRDHSSFKKSMNTIRSRNGKKNAAQKRKAGSSELVFGTNAKKAKVGFMEESAMQFPIRGKSASALATSDIPVPPAAQVAAAGAGTATGYVAPSGILRKGSAGSGHGKAAGLVPDFPTSGAYGVMQQNKETKQPGASNDSSKPPVGTLNGSSHQVSSKRKPEGVPDLPTSGSFKRMKREE